MKKHIIFIAIVTLFTALIAFLAYDLLAVEPFIKSQYTVQEYRAWQVATIGLCIGYPIIILTIYILCYRPSWAIQKPKAEKAGTAQKRKQKRQ